MKRTILVGAAIFAAWTTFAAGTWYVDDDNYGKGGDGTTPETAFGTIQDAIDAATTQAGDTIKVLPGVYDQGGYTETRTSGAKYVTRVWINKYLIVEATTNDPSATVIVGAWDPESSTGVGTNAVRCVYATGGSIVRGFTLRDGAAHETSASGVSFGGGFRAADGEAGNDSAAYLVDCVVTNCAALKGAAVMAGTSVRCRMLGNVGTIVYQARLVNCLVAGSRAADHNVADKSRLYNATLVNNECRFVLTGTEDASTEAYNCAIQYNEGAVSKGGAVLTAAHSLVIPWNSTVSTPTDCVTETDDLVFFSPATGDYGPVANTAIVGLGDASLLASLDLPDGIDAFTDLDGGTIPTSGAIVAGAYQTTTDATTASGAITFDAPVCVNGHLSLGGGVYCRTAGGQAEVNLSIPKEDGKELVCFGCDTLIGKAIYPQMDDTVWMLTPTNSPDGNFKLNFTVVTASGDRIRYVNPDPKFGSDANDGLSEKTPYLTLTNACAKLAAYSIIHCAAGVYTNGYISASSFGKFRIYDADKSYVRFKGAGADKSFIYGAKDPATPEGEEDGRGENAVRCIFFNRSACVQGFTLANSYAYPATTADGHLTRGGVILVPADSRPGQISDCVISNGWAAKGTVAYRAVIRRSVLKGTLATLNTSSFFNCYLSSCLVAADAGATVILDSSVSGIQGCTILGLDGTDPVTTSIKPRNSLVYSSVLPKTYTGSVCSKTLNDFHFADYESEPPDWRVMADSPAVGKGVMPDFRYYSSDITGRPLTWVDGCPVAGAYQEVLPDNSYDFYIDPVNGDDAAIGRDKAKAVKTLKAILAKPTYRGSGTTVHLAAGVYSSEVFTVTYNAGKANETNVYYRLSIPAGVTVVGDKGAKETIIAANGSAANEMRGVYFQGEDAVLKGVTVTGGYCDSTAFSGADAAACRCDLGGSCVNCIISNNINVSRTSGRGTSACGNGSYYGCLIVKNSGNYTGYSISDYVNCTLVDNNKGADMTRGNTKRIVNSLMLDSSCTIKDFTYITNSVFALAATKTTDLAAEAIGSLNGKTKADVGLNADYTLSGASLARDFCTDAPEAEDCLDTDLIGARRVRNGVIDCGAFEFPLTGTLLLLY